MKTAMVYGPRDLRVEEVEFPAIEPDDVLVQVKASGICGSDVHRYLGTAYGRGRWAYPLNSGHEYCGDVVQVGSGVETYTEGDRVTLGVAWTSGELGAFSEYIRVPDADSRLYRLPSEVSYVDGALIETLLVAAKSIHRPNPTPEDHVLILGAGPIGLCVLLCCWAHGIRDIVVSEPSAKRRALADRIGATTVNPAEVSLRETVLDTTGGRGADVTFECAGAEETLNQAFALTVRDGRICLIGHYRETPRFNIEDLVIGGMNVYGPMSGHPFYDETVQLLLDDKVDLAQLVSHKYPLDQAREAFETACDVHRSVKVILMP
jgi:2-desacetyl-2-hydroxyethyl bacteriochlorophyllide A dehydrogenase